MRSSQGSYLKKHIRAALLLQATFVIALALEALACWVLFSKGYPPPEEQWLHALYLHCGAAAVPLAYQYAPKRYPGSGWYIPKLTGLLTLFLPGIGIVGSALTVNLTKIFVRSKGLAHEFESGTYHFDSDTSDIINRSMDDLLREELATEPVVDILRGDDDDLKRGAIMLLKRMKNSRAVALLKESLSDPSTEIRFFAHTALTQLEEDAVERLEKAEERASGGDAEALRDFANTCKSYALSGLPEDSMRTYYLEEARNQFERHFTATKNPTTMIDIGLVCIELEQYPAALTAFTRALDWNETMIMGRLGRCWVHYDTKDWGSLRTEMKNMSRISPDKLVAPDPLSGDDQYVRALFTFWAQQQGPVKNISKDRERAA